MPDWVELDLDQPDAQKCPSSAPVVVVNDSNFEEIMSRRDIPMAHYVFDGYMQYMKTLEPYAYLLRNRFSWKRVDPIEGDCVCLHHRGTDHGGGSLIVDPGWFSSILEQERFSHLNIITDDKFASGMFDAFRKWNPEIRCSPNALDDFNWMRQHRRVIIPNSTFSLIAALTGYASMDGGVVYQFKRCQSIPYIQHELSFARQVDGKYWMETRG